MILVHILLTNTEASLICKETRRATAFAYHVRIGYYSFFPFHSPPAAAAMLLK